MPESRRVKLARIRSFVHAQAQESKGLEEMPVSKYSLRDIRAFAKDRSYSGVNCRAPFCRFSPRLCSRSHASVAARLGFIATLVLFLRNKYVSFGKQEAISVGLADRGNSCDSVDSRWLPRAAVASLTDLVESISKSDPRYPDRRLIRPRISLVCTCTCKRALRVSSRYI